MKKSDLKTGMRVETRRGGLYLVLKDVDTKYFGHQDIGFVSENTFMNGDEYKEDLTENYYHNGDFDIIRVYGISNIQESGLNGNTLNLDVKHLIWEREEVKELTVEEVSEKLGYEVKIVK